MKTLASDLKEKKNLSTTTIGNYVRSLKIANCKQNFDSLDFLKKKKKVEECLQPYKEGSKKAIITAICSVLNFYKKETLHKYYYDKLIAFTKPELHEKSEAQKENWMEWSDVLKIKDDLKNKADTHENRLKYMVMCMYTEIEPRRVLDYVAMHVVPKLKTDLSTLNNYIALKENVFVFNRYKTQGKYGQQKITVPTELRKSIDEYLETHPLKDESNYPFLVTREGNAFKGSSSITMMLNRVFKKKISASMLRHIYISHKFGSELKERERVANNMAHSMSQQKEYIKY